MSLFKWWVKWRHILLTIMGAASSFDHGNEAATSTDVQVPYREVCKPVSSMSQILQPHCASQIHFGNKIVYLQQMIGLGSYSTVLLGDLANSSDPLAIKVFHAKDAIFNETDDQYMDRIMGEYEIVSRLSHPNIIKSVALVQHGLSWLLVTEYCPQPLENADGGLSQKEISALFLQILKGVEYLHTHRVAHLDLKIANILICSNGQATISDFGSASIFQKSLAGPLVPSFGAIGTEMYLAPEVYGEEGYDPRPVDIWALAVLFCNLHIPEAILFENFTRANTSFAKFFESRRSEIVRFLPGPAKGLLRQMLSENPARRPTISSLLKSAWISAIEAQMAQIQN